MLIAGGVYKVFQMATDLREMKDILREIKHNTHDYTVHPAAVAPQPVAVSPDAILTPDA